MRELIKCVLLLPRVFSGFVFSTIFFTNSEVMCKDDGISQTNNMDRNETLTIVLCHFEELNVTIMHATTVPYHKKTAFKIC